MDSSIASKYNQNNVGDFLEAHRLFYSGSDNQSTIVKLLFPDKDNTPINNDDENIKLNGQEDQKLAQLELLRCREEFESLKLINSLKVKTNGQKSKITKHTF